MPAPTLSWPVRLGLLCLGLIGAVMVWGGWSHPKPGVGVFTGMMGGVLIVLAIWGLALPSTPGSDHPS